MCTLSYCHRPGRNKDGAGLCEGHYYQQRRGQEFRPLAEPIVGTKCGVDGCPEDRPYGYRYCHMHAARIARHGNPDARYDNAGKPGESNPNWRGDEVGYGGVHQRLYRIRGSAKDYDCACGRVAAQWAYVGPREPGQRQPHSADLSLYEPMCVSCHKRFDLAAVAALTKHPNDASLF